MREMRFCIEFNLEIWGFVIRADFISEPEFQIRNDSFPNKFLSLNLELKKKKIGFGIK